MVLTEFTEIDQINETLNSAGNKPVLIFKYSPVCPVSHYSQNEFNIFIDENSQLHDKVVFCQVNVIAARPVSKEIESKFGIKHESPQAILIQNGEVVWNDSHSGVNRQSLDDQVGDVV